jgi:hypothetical protein
VPLAPAVVVVDVVAAVTLEPLAPPVPLSGPSSPPSLMSRPPIDTSFAPHATIDRSIIDSRNRHRRELDWGWLIV